jgi:hypothetical protein
MNKDCTTKGAIMVLKELYDIDGMYGCNKIFKQLMKRNPERFRRIKFLMKVVYSFDTCFADCWNNLASKKYFCCACYDDPIIITLDMNDDENYEEGEA